MKKMKSLILVLVLMVSAPAFALEVGALGGLSYWNSGYTVVGGGSVTTAANMDWSGGAFVKTSFNALFDIEADVLYVKKKSTWTALGIPSILEAKSYQIPVMLRTSFVPGGFVNVGAGAYYEIGSSDGVSVNGASQSYSAASLKSHDLGLVGSAQLRLPMAPLFHILVDARYLLGLLEQSTDPLTFTMKNRYFQAFAGLALGF